MVANKIFNDWTSFCSIRPLCRGWQDRGRTSGCRPISMPGCRVQVMLTCTWGALGVHLGCTKSRTGCIVHNVLSHLNSLISKFSSTIFIHFRCEIKAILSHFKCQISKFSSTMVKIFIHHRCGIKAILSHSNFLISKFSSTVVKIFVTGV